MVEYQKYVHNQINVLIISDRLMGLARGLPSYLCSTGFHVVGLVENKEQALKLADQTIDFLIIAGYLENQRSYEVINEYKNLHKTFLTVHWAMLDSLIADYCKQYQIPLSFERTRPMADFAAYLKECSLSCTELPDEVIDTIQNDAEKEEISKSQYTFWNRLKKHFWNR